MSDARYLAYRNSCIQLAKTLFVKMSDMAAAVNQVLIDQNIAVDTTDPTTWKYYLNMAGVRHSSDPVITIKSFEAGVVTEIEFTRQNLASRPETLKQYAYGTPLYRSLVAQYPTEETRIIGVVQPINSDNVNLLEYPDNPAALTALVNSYGIAIANSVITGIKASDGQILQYDTTLVESNEYDLIPELQKWITNVINRWYTPIYNITDDLYLIVFMGNLFVNMPNTIMNIRLRNNRTPRVHSFLVRMYLESNGGLGTYADKLALEQRLWLYRNIRYIIRNAGKQDTLQMLIDNLMTPRSLPLNRAYLRHNLLPLPGSFRPDVEVVMKQLNLVNQNAGEIIRSVDEILEEEVVFSRHKDLDVAGLTVAVTDQMATAPGDLMPTKVLECAVLDETDSVAYPLADVLLHNWVYLAANNLYLANVYVDVPVSGAVLMLEPIDAFLLYVYCNGYSQFKNADGTPYVIADVPTGVRVYNIVNPTVPNLFQLESVVDVSKVTTAMLDLLLASPIDMSVVYTSTVAFYNAMKLIQQYLMRNRDIYSSSQHYMVRAYLEQAANLFLMDVDVTLAQPGQTYAAWLLSKGIDLTGLQPADYATLATNILKAATGTDQDNTVPLKDLQAATISIMRALSSYGVQYIETINSSSLIVEDAPALRVGDVDVAAVDGTSVEVVRVTAIDYPAVNTDGIQIDLVGQPSPSEITLHLTELFTAETPVALTPSENHTGSMHLRISSSRVAFVDDNPLDLSAIDDYLQLPMPV